MKVNLPVKLRVRRLGQVTSGLFAAHPEFQEFVVHAKPVFELIEHVVTHVLFDLDGPLGPLVVHGRLTPERVGSVVLFGYHRVSRGKFIDARGAMTHVLPRDVDGHLDVKLELDHLKRSRMKMTHEVPDESGVPSGTLGPVAVGYAGGLNDRRVEVLLGHVVHEANEAAVEYFDHLWTVSVPYL